MSVAYRTSTSFDYNDYGRREDYDRQTDARAAVKKAADRRAVMARRVLVMFVAVLAAGVCIGLLYVKAQIYMAQRDINTTQAAIHTADKLNSVLQEQYSEAMDVNKLMDRAKLLGMGYPTGDQVLYVDLAGTGTVEMKK
jgi:cell division protein FtsL